MSNNQLLIPDTLRVGFQKRDDTYTKRLAYVIYYDQTNKLRKEKSWEGWRDKKITPKDVANEPTEGFVLNRNVGGVSRYSRSWDQRMEKCRVYDPRGWEFEITIPNLLFILEECTSTKGKGLEGQFVYGWSGTELVLLPVTSKEYKESQKFTKLQAKKITAKDLVIGATYHTKQQEDWVYLGKFDWYENESEYVSKSTHEVIGRRYQYGTYGTYYTRTYQKKTGKKYVFVQLNDQYGHSLEKRADLTNLAAIVDETCVENYAELFELFSKSEHASFYTGLVATPIPAKNFSNEKSSSNKKTWYSTYEDYFTEKFNGMNPVTLNADGSYTMYSVKQYCTLDPTGKRDQYGGPLYVHNGVYLLLPISKVWFQDGKKCDVTLDHSSKQHERYTYNKQTGRSENVDKQDNIEWNEQVVMPLADFVNVGFHKLEIEFESKIKKKVKEY